VIYGVAWSGFARPPKGVRSLDRNEHAVLDDSRAVPRMGLGVVRAFEGNAAIPHVGTEGTGLVDEDFHACGECFLDCLLGLVINLGVSHDLAFRCADERSLAD